jgi:phenylpyruvate tautomerase PptA (4-oxalocrotonate tautomerase family)
MEMTDRARRTDDGDRQSPGGTRRLSRRALLATTTATAVAGVAGASTAQADPAPLASGFGAPLAELHFPAGTLSPEQKAVMIKGVTDVLLKATNLAPDQASKLWVQIFETAESGWGVGGQVFVHRSK